MLDFLSDDVRRDPHRAYAALREASPVFHAAPIDAWVLLDHANVKRALSDHATFSSNVSPSRGHAFEWLLFMDPPRHGQLRAIVQTAFSPRAIAALEPRIEELVRSLLDRERGHGHMEVCADFAGPLPMMVIAEMLGIGAADWPFLDRWGRTTMGLASTIVGTPESARVASEAFLAADAEMSEWLDRLAREPRGDDLVGRLVRSDLSRKETLRFIQLLLAAGTETTTNLIANAIVELAEHPEALDRIRAEPALLESAIEEVLRHRSPAQIMFRMTTRDVELHDQVIPRGKMVFLAIGSANRDPAVFSDPDTFDIARSPNPHLAFGHGIHFCLGAMLSRLEARVAIGEFVRRVEHVELATRSWQPRAPFHVHGPEKLPIQIHRTNRPSRRTAS